MSRAIAYLLASTLGIAPGVAEPVRISAEIGGTRAVIEIRNLPEEEATLAIRQALATLAQVERQLSLANPESALAHLNDAAGKGLRTVDGDIGRMLQSVLGYCLWSRGAQGPLGGVLYSLWEQATVHPSGRPLESAAQSAGCNNLVLQPESMRASVAAGSRLDLRHFAAGYGVDSAMRDLQQAGATDAWIEFGRVMRALGPGPTGRGWEVTLPIFPGMNEPLDPLVLRDRALAVVSTHLDRFRMGDVSYSPFLDQRTGLTSQGTIGVLALSELAIDAQAIATTMLILGNREGQLRLSGVLPSPSVLWLLGDGSGEPLLTTYKWSLVR